MIVSTDGCQIELGPILLSMGPRNRVHIAMLTNYNYGQVPVTDSVSHSSTITFMSLKSTMPSSPWVVLG